MDVGWHWRAVPLEKGLALLGEVAPCRPKPKLPENVICELPPPSVRVDVKFRYTTGQEHSYLLWISRDPEVAYLVVLGDEAVVPVDKAHYGRMNELIRPLADRVRGTPK